MPIAVENNEIDERIEKCEKILATNPNSQIFAALAEAYRRKGTLDKAFRICQNGLKVHPSYGSAHIVMAKINLDRRLYDWAEAEVQKAIEVDGKSRAIELLLAEIYLYRGEYDRATRLLKALHRTDEGNAQIKRLLEIARQIPEEQEAQKSGGIRLSVAETVVETNAKPVAEPEVEKPQEISSSDILKQAMAIENVLGAQFVNREGLTIEAQWRANFDEATCGAVLGEIGTFLNSEMVKASFGEVQTVLVENEGYVFYLLRVSNGMFLFVADAEVNLGTLRMRLSDLMGRFHQ